MMIFDPSVPVIVGGIAGMTLSMTGVKGIHDLCDKVLTTVLRLPEEKGLFATMTPYKTILHYTLYLIAGFFISEIFIFISFLGIQRISIISTITLGYIVLIITLGFMLFIYSIMLLKLPSEDATGERMKDFENITAYPESPA